MSTLLLIRHGQASFGTENYDRLSELGMKQSRLLGEYWAARGQKLDAVFCGAQERQKQTLLAVRDAYIERGLPFLTHDVIAGFNEYDSQGIMMRLFPKLMEEDKRIQEVIRGSTGMGGNTPQGRKSFQEIFEIVVNRWIRGDVEAPGLESWVSFYGRVEKGIRRIMSEFPNGKTVAVFTSGGPISATMRFALGTSDETAINLSWVIKNASINEFKYNAERFSLTGFNMTPQFQDDALVTYR